MSDPDGVIASPHATLAVRGLDQVAAEIAAEVTRLGVERVVLGLPLALDGREGEAARRARLLADRVRARIAAPIVLWDERLTTRAAERALREGGVRAKQQRAVVDQVAAALLLQSYLDAERAAAERAAAEEKDDGER